ncbi:DUF763 domain-containing protein [Mucilaginibacter gilvus]|uniref:DUF763 domain-containing protein n=1 Tax=Mucilaginibacter gilvus TaxID=2305909 RepID=UPI001FBB7573|nr:DUF763 domain-containing protein [Mucilaginibacter gilvus]
MKKSGFADMPLHYGHVPAWLAERMARLGLAVVENIVLDYGKDEVLRRLSDPFWFQSLGSVMGMDWHSSGITTSVMGALKKAINPHSRELDIYICGGKGRHSKNTPQELIEIGSRTGLDGNYLVKCSKVSAKVDNTAIQDGFQLYTHNFILSDTGKWAVVQQGMSDASNTTRRYHWHSEQLTSFVDDPHTSIYGKNNGLILNMTDSAAAASRNGVMQIAAEPPERMLKEISKLVMPNHHDVRAKDVDLKRLGTVLWLSRFNDPARFSFAHGGKDGHPFPVPTKVYDETICTLQMAIHKAK